MNILNNVYFYDFYDIYKQIFNKMKYEIKIKIKSNSKFSYI